MQGPLYSSNKPNDGGYEWEYSSRTRTSHRSARDSESSDSTTYSYEAISDVVTDENGTSSASSYASVSPGPPNEQETTINNDIARGKTSPITTSTTSTTTKHNDTDFLPSNKTVQSSNEKIPSYNVRDLLRNTSPDPPKQLFNLTTDRESTSTKTYNGGVGMIKSDTTQSKNNSLRGLADDVGHDNRAALPDVSATMYDTPNVNFRYKDPFCPVGSISNGHAYQPIADKPPFMGYSEKSVIPLQASLMAENRVKQMNTAVTSANRLPSCTGQLTNIRNIQLKTPQTDQRAERQVTEGMNYWRKPLIDQIVITDVTTNYVTVTVKECLTDKGFFKPRPSGIV